MEKGMPSVIQTIAKEPIIWGKYQYMKSGEYMEKITTTQIHPNIIYMDHI